MSWNTLTLSEYWFPRACCHKYWMCKKFDHMHNYFISHQSLFVNRRLTEYTFAWMLSFSHSFVGFKFGNTLTYSDLANELMAKIGCASRARPQCLSAVTSTPGSVNCSEIRTHNLRYLCAKFRHRQVRKQNSVFKPENLLQFTRYK